MKGMILFWEKVILFNYLFYSSWAIMQQSPQQIFFKAQTGYRKPVTWPI